MIKTQTQTPVAADQSLAVVQDFVADHLGNLVGVGHPCRMITALRSTWVIPLVLTSPGYGAVGVVGVVTVDDELGYIVGWTPVDEIRANAERLSHERETELAAAFQALRTTNSPEGHG
ncbi:MAG: hypothetical protein MAG451_02111 [Anaerolineales bacterium]|nr:hypothetical protein [Anaerolineales bacterium]